MIGNLYIDGRDVYALYGVFTAQGAYDDLLCYASLKSVAVNDWQEEDGEEPDLSAPVLDSREVAVKFAVHGSNYALGAFVGMFEDGAYHTFDFRDLGRSFKLRLVSQPNLAAAYGLGLVTLRFADDFPLDGYVYEAPQSEIIPTQGYEIDDVDLSRYGVRILKGTLEEIEKSPSVKKNLLRDISVQSGVIYDGQRVTFETKEVRLNCLMRAESLPEFWRNYDALLFDLRRPHHRGLYVETTGELYPCYYKGCSVSEFCPSDGVWFRFSITLVFTSFRVGADEYILAAERGEWVVTQAGDAAVDMVVYEEVKESFLNSEAGAWVITEDKKYIDTKEVGGN